MRKPGRTLAAFLALCLCISLFPGCAEAQGLLPADTEAASQAASPADPFAALRDYLIEKGTYASECYIKAWKSVTEEGTYGIWYVPDSDTFQFTYLSNDHTTTVLIEPGRDGASSARVIIQSDNETVTGDVDFQSADYVFGRPFADYRYTTEYRNWGYENFNVRADRAIRNTLLYAEMMLIDANIQVTLSDLGFAGWKHASMIRGFDEREIAGRWEYHREDENASDSGTWPLCFCLLDGAVYGWAFNPEDGNRLTVEEIRANAAGLLLAESLRVSPYDGVTGEIIATCSQPGAEDPEQLRLVIDRDDQEKLRMRVEALDGGLNTPLDSLVFTKAEDPDEVTLQGSGSASDTGSQPEETQAASVPSSQPVQQTPTASGRAPSTAGERNALELARQYLAYTAFSRTGLIGQLEYEGCSHADASFAADNCGADWNEQALAKALEYLDYSAFSYSGLIEQLKYEGFTDSQAAYGADRCGADWNRQAAKKAEEYLDFTSFTWDELVAQLEYEGFTSSQAAYGADHAG